MSNTFEVEVTVKVPLTVELVARWFAGVSDEEQTEFFVKVAEIAQTWRDSTGQWSYLGGHLRKFVGVQQRAQGACYWTLCMRWKLARMGLRTRSETTK